jgi:hypothetical protein
LLAQASEGPQRHLRRAVPGFVKDRLTLTSALEGQAFERSSSSTRANRAACVDGRQQRIHRAFVPVDDRPEVGELAARAASGGSTPLMTLLPRHYTGSLIR